LTPATSIRELLQVYKADPGSLTPGQLSSVERILRRQKDAAERKADGNGSDTGRRALRKEEIAEALGVHPRTITRYAGEGMPHEQGGHGTPHLYNLAECIEWLRAQGRNPFEMPEERPEEGTKAGVDLKLRREKARLAELDRLEREGALHDTGDCRQRRLRQLWALKREFLALPRSAAPELEGHDRTDIEGILAKRVTGILERFAEGYVDGEA